MYDLAYAFLKRIDILKRKIEEKEEKLRSKEYRITSRVSYDKVSGGTTTVSRVETFALDLVSLEHEINFLKNKLLNYMELMHRAGLTEEEMKVLIELSGSKRLSRIARDNNIYVSRVYKIRDRGLNKLLNMLIKTDLI